MMDVTVTTGLVEP